MRYIITGGPGFGKTAIIQGMNERGFHYVGESSRKLISELKLTEGRDPREDRERFQGLIVSRRINDFYENDQEIVFFDRGVHDKIAYFYSYQLKPSKECHEFCSEYRYDKVFVVPPWKEIYLTDHIRKETFSEACGLHDLIVQSYVDTEHNIIEVPRSKLNERVDYVLNHIIKS